ncbi:MAG: hypothetical protein ACKV19_17280 [Verrucomicrobiales bacterium]
MTAILLSPIKRIPVPMHYQDTSVHCGLACAMMILDWLKRGAFTRPSPLPGSVMSQFRMHWWIHDQSSKDGTFWTSPAQLRMLINESPVAASSLGGIRAYEVVGTRQEIRALIDNELSHGRPAVVHTASSDAAPGHWVVVVGRSPILPGRDAGYFVLNPWVFNDGWAYGEKDDQPAILCYDYTGQSAPRVFVHTRGHGCVCPHWQGQDNPAIGEEFIPRLALEERIGWGSVPPRGPEKCHAVLLSPPIQLPDIPDLFVDLKPLPPPEPFGDRILADPRFLNHAAEQLKSFGVVGRRAPAVWKRAFVDAPPTVVAIQSPSKPLVLAVWSESKDGSRLGALFDRAGNLQAAAILRHWPIVRPPAAFARWFRSHAVRLCSPAGLALDPQSAEIMVNEELYWKATPHSRFPWWPFYVVRVATAAKGTVKLYVDMQGRVHTSLRSGQRMGG